MRQGGTPNDPALGRWPRHCGGPWRSGAGGVAFRLRQHRQRLRPGQECAGRVRGRAQRTAHAAARPHLAPAPTRRAQHQRGLGARAGRERPVAGIRRRFCRERDRDERRDRLHRASGRGRRGPEHPADRRPASSRATPPRTKASSNPSCSGGKSKPPGEVVDAEAEAERLRENIEAGESVTTGETPTIKRREKALLEDLF